MTKSIITRSNVCSANSFWGNLAGRWDNGDNTKQQAGLSPGPLGNAVYNAFTKALRRATRF
jgi:hypothetical protein